MEFTRNHYLIIGVLLFLAGLQFRYVTSFTLNESTSRFVDKKLGAKPALAPQTSLFSFSPPPVLDTRRVVRPPRWLGFSLMSVGAVLFVFSLTMKKPGS